MLIYNETLAELHSISSRACNELLIINVINHEASEGGTYYAFHVKGFY